VISSADGRSGSKGGMAGGQTGMDRRAGPMRNCLAKMKARMRPGMVWDPVGEARAVTVCRVVIWRGVVQRVPIRLQARGSLPTSLVLSLG